MKASTIALITLLLASCSTEAPLVNSDGDVIINKELYDLTETNSYSIENAHIANDSLFFTLNSSGCDGSSWVAKLIDSGFIAESYPVQRFAKISLENEEVCDALPSRSFAINITPLKTSDDKIIIHLEGWESNLLYEYEVN
jgi:hypothetical protein